MSFFTTHLASRKRPAAPMRSGQGTAFVERCGSRRLTRAREEGADAFGLGGAEPGEDPERLPPAAPSRLHAVGVAEGNPEQFQRAGLTPAVPDLPGNGQRALLAVDRLLEPSQLAENLAQVVQAHSLVPEIAELLLDRQRPPMTIHRLREPPQIAVRLPEVVESLTLAVGVVDLPGDGQSLLFAPDRLLEPLHVDLAVAEAAQGPGLALAVADLPADGHAPLEHVANLLADLQQFQIEVSQAGQHPRLGLAVASLTGSGKPGPVRVPPVGPVRPEVEEAPRGVGELPGNGVEPAAGGLLGGGRE